ncbi:MAG TPA: acyl-CoA dehydrogenase [Chloroflexi bacterium]|jgi:alkylation response protein AidB-like acyl-CoA dehydrogenase|nr:acyl-CoA dehydrogenase [Chloroflexota bacterium]
MDFSLSGDEEDILDLVREFATNEVLPRAAQIDEKAEFPADLVSKMGELGLMGVPFPEEYGGAGQSYVVFARIVEELCRACASTGLIMDVNISLCGEPIMVFGSEAQKQKYLVPLATGEKLGALAMTEPEAGSDAASIKTSADRRNDHYLLNGRKIFITNGEVADTYVVTAVTDRDKGTSGITDFIVEKEMPGVSFATHYDKMGIRGAPTTDVVLENVEVPVDNVLGGEGNGFKVTMDTLDAGRIGIAAQAVGIARAALEDATDYARTRRQFGATISTFQGLQFMLADMATQVHASRALMLRAAYLRDQEIACARESSMAKLFAGDTAMQVTTDAVQIFGGYGYMQEYPVERHMRDAKITQIYEGTQQIQRVVIARQVIGR